MCVFLRTLFKRNHFKISADIENLCAERRFIHPAAREGDQAACLTLA